MTPRTSLVLFQEVEYLEPTLPLSSVRLERDLQNFFLVLFPYL